MEVSRSMENRKIKIGGEFEINPELIHSSDNLLSRNSNTLFSSGRSALMAILQKIQNDGGNKSLIYLPYYICSSVVEACQNTRFDVKFYEIDQTFLFPLEFIDNIEKKASLLSVNYFGLVNDNNILEALKNKRPDIITISDNVQSLWECHKSVANFSFTSFRKHIATPDGAIVYQKGEIVKPQKDILENVFYNNKLSGAIAKYREEEDRVYLNFFEEGEIQLEHETKTTKASQLSEYVFQNIDWENIKMARKNNYHKVHEIGSKNGLNFIFPYSEKDSPLCVPILVENRDEIRRNLFKHNIFLPIHWPIESYNKKSNLSNNMAKNELSLVIDQRYSLIEMVYQIETLTALMK